MITRKLKVATGHIMEYAGERGPLELVSLGDYGADVNLDQYCPVPDGTPLLPLERKWVVTISTQYGCSMGCKFCDVPSVGPGLNATLNDLKGQILDGLSCHPEVVRTDRLNIHYARMGEPTFNRAVLDCSRWLAEGSLLGGSLVHPVVSTMLPRRNTNLLPFLLEWCEIKNALFAGNAGLQFSVNSTNDTEREVMFGGSSRTLSEIAWLARMLPKPTGRKYTLNFATGPWEIDAGKLAALFSPDDWIVKLTPIHETRAVSEFVGAVKRPDYAEHAANLKAAGFDTLVFIASEEEDLGMITCGNAILSGRNPNKYEVVQ